jgi:hypothetical protein
MKWNRRRSAILMAKLLMRAALPYLGKSQCDEPVDDFARLEDRHARHG